MGEEAKVVLITGTSTGIGRATAVELARRGHAVFASMRDLAKADGVRADAAAAGAAVELVVLDVRDDASVRAAVTHVVAEAGRLDVVVNNAAALTTAPLERTSDDELATLFDTNVYGPFRVARAAVPVMRAQGHGRIVNVGSLAAEPRTGLPMMAAYAMSKAALRAFSLELTKEVRPFGIDVVLCEDGVGGQSAMTGTVEATLGARAVTPDSDYTHLESALAAFYRFFQTSAPPPEGAARVVADACTVAPIGAYHPADQARIEAARTMGDDVFLALCDPSTRAETVARLGPAAGAWALWG